MADDWSTNNAPDARYRELYTQMRFAAPPAEGEHNQAWWQKGWGDDDDGDELRQKRRRLLNEKLQILWDRTIDWSTIEHSI